MGLLNHTSNRGATVIAECFHITIVGLFFIVAGCRSLPAEKPVNSTLGEITVSEIHKSGPVVVFESGLGSHKEVWNKIFPVISNTNTTFAYDRPGVGRSQSTTRTRDGERIVEDLRLLLQEQNLSPPYVLVGHSAGGLYLQLYACKYPQEVAGLVLVDPTHPTQFEGEGSMEHRGSLSRFLVSVALSKSAKTEFDLLTATGREVLEALPVDDKLPMVILTAPDKSGTTIAKFDNAKRADLARLYPSATVRELDGGHNIPQTNPDAVITAIRDVLDAYAVAENQTLKAGSNPANDRE